MIFLCNIFLFIIGTIWGSFLNVCITRLPQGKSIIAPRSSCPNCGHPIKPYHNIPLISFIILKGRCHHCAWKIPVRYFLVEFISGLIIVLLHHHFQFSVIFFFYAILCLLLIVITFIDIEHKLILNNMTIPGMILGILLSRLTNVQSVSDIIFGITSGSSFLLLVAILGKMIFKKESMGGGDIKLAAMIGSFVGFDGVIVTLFWGFTSAALIGGFYAYRFKTEYIPFGPFICCGTLIFIFTNNQFPALQFLIN